MKNDKRKVVLLKAAEMDPLYEGARGEVRRKPPTVEAFVSQVKALRLGADSGWSPRAAGSLYQK